MKTIKIIFGGDLYADKNNDYSMSDELCDLFKSANYSILNLEAPISNRPIMKSPKAGPSLIQSENVIEILNKLNVRYISGANNHIMDYGKEGMDDTIKNLQKNNISHAGFGSNLDEAESPISLADSNVVIISTAEEEFGVAESNRPGIYSMYDDRVLSLITSLRATGKLVIVVAHGGGEKIPLPSAYIYNRYKQFIDAGAEAVVAHHPHVIQGILDYKSKPIFFSLGNFKHSFDKKNLGMIAILTIENEKVADYETKFIDPNINGELAISPGAGFKDYLSRLSEVLGDDVSFRSLIQEQSVYMYKKYYENYFKSLFKPKHSLKNIMIEKLTGRSRRNDSLLLLHLLRNRSHKEFVEIALEVLNGETEDVRRPETASNFKYLNGFCN